MLSLLRAQLDLVKMLGDSLRAIAEFPTTLQETMRETNALVADARETLARLGGQIERMMDQLDNIGEMSDRLIAGTKTITSSADGAQTQMERAIEQLVAANRSLDQIVRLIEPLNRVSTRVSEGFLRATGRRAVPGDPVE